MIAHAYGYAYRVTGDQAYKTMGTALFNTSVQHGVTGSHKHYNQQFRSSGLFPACVSATSPGTAAPQPPTNVRIIR